MGAEVGEACEILRAGLLAGVGTGPASAFLEFRGVIVEEFVDGHGGDEDTRCLHWLLLITSFQLALQDHKSWAESWSILHRQVIAAVPTPFRRRNNYISHRNDSL